MTYILLVSFTTICKVNGELSFCCQKKPCVIKLVFVVNVVVVVIDYFNNVHVYIINII